MKLAKRSRLIWLSVAIASSISAVAAIVGIVLFALNESYVLMGLSIAITAHGFYGAPFYFIAFAGASDCVLVCTAAEHLGLLKLEEISEFSGIKPEYLPPIISKCIKRGYIREFVPVEENFDK